MAAVLTEYRHDAVIGLPGTQKSVAVDASRLISRTNSTVHGVCHGDSTWSLLVKQKCWCVVALLVSLVQTRTFCDGYVARPSR